MTNNAVTLELLSKIENYLDEQLPNPTNVCDDDVWSIQTGHILEDESGAGFESYGDEPVTYAQIEVLDFDGAHDFRFLEAVLAQVGVTPGTGAEWLYSLQGSRFNVFVPLAE